MYVVYSMFVPLALPFAYAHQELGGAEVGFGKVHHYALMQPWFMVCCLGGGGGGGGRISYYRLIMLWTCVKYSMKERFQTQSVMCMLFHNYDKSEKITYYQ